MPLLRPVVIACLAASLALVGCGGTSGGPGPDPASSIPAGAPIYVELLVRPEGEQREKMERLAAKILRTPDPGRRIVELLESLAEEGRGGSYERDVKPWLGPRVGVAVSDLAAEEPGFVAAVAAEDPDAAREVVEREARRDGARRRSHRDVAVWVDEDGEAVAVAGDFVLFADSEQALRGAIDAQEGETLAESERFEKALEPLPEERAGVMYFDLQGVLDAAGASGQLGPMERQLLGQLLGGDAPPTAVAVLAEADSLALESHVDEGDLSGPLKSLSGLGVFSGSPLAGQVPGDAWLSLGVRKLGASARSLVEAFAGPLGGGVIAGQLQREYGIDLERDVYSWIGDVALFARGSGVEALEGGLVIEVLNAARARSALPRLLGALQQESGLAATPVTVPGALQAFELIVGAPQPLVVALDRERVVVALGMRAAADALQPPSRLAATDRWSRAKRVLGGIEPGFLLDAPAVLRLVEEAIGDEEGLVQARPYLQTIALVAAGAARDGDKLRSRLAVAVR